MHFLAILTYHVFVAGIDVQNLVIKQLCKQNEPQSVKCETRRNNMEQIFASLDMSIETKGNIKPVA